MCRVGLAALSCTFTVRLVFVPAGLAVEGKGRHHVHERIRINEKTMHSFVVIVAERLRRLTRNQLGSARAGSSPADDDVF